VVSDELGVKAQQMCKKAGHYGIPQLDALRLGLCRLYGGLGELDLCHDDSLERPDSKSHIGAAREEAGSGFGKHWHMMDARKQLINLLYLASAQSSEVPGWSHREIKKGLILRSALEGIPEPCGIERTRGDKRMVSSCTRAKPTGGVGFALATLPAR